MLKHCRTVTPTRDASFPSHSASGVVGNTRRSSSVPPKLDRNMVQENAAASEQSLVAAKASVVRYDEVCKKWVPVGESPSGISKVQIFHEPVNKTYRVVGRKIQDKEVTLNTMLSHTLRYSEATPTFHQWRDSLKIIHGLHFATKDDAISFSKAINAVLRILQLHSLPDPSFPQKGLNEQLHVVVPQPISSAYSNQTEVSSLSSGKLLLKNGSVQHSSSTALPHQQPQQQQPNLTWQHLSPSQQNQWGQSTSMDHARGNGLYQYPAKSQSFTNIDSYNVNTSVQQPVYSEPTAVGMNSQPQEKYMGYYNNPPANFSHQPVNNNTNNNYAIDNKQQQEQQHQFNGQQPPCDTTFTNVNLFAAQNVYSQPPLHQYRVGSVSAESLLSDQDLTQQTITGSISSDEKSNTAAETLPTFAPPLPGPPPPPPIPMGGIPTPPRSTARAADTTSGSHLTGLAAALQSTVLKKTVPKVETSGIPAPLVGTKAVLMEEMQRKLARRRAKADGEDVPSNGSSIRSSPFHAISRSNTASPFAQRPSPQSQDTMYDNTQFNNQSTDVTQHNGEPAVGIQVIDQSQEPTLSPQLQQLKQELLIELREDLLRLRHELLAAIRNEAVDKSGP